MFRNLVRGYLNIVSYLMTALVSFGTATLGIAPFGAAFIGAMIDQKVPILISFVISFAIYLIKFGLNSALRFLIIIVVYALFISLAKNKDVKYKNMLKYILSGLIASLFLIFIGLEKTPNALALILEILFSASLMIVFSLSLKAILKIKEKEKVDYKELISFGVLVASLFSGFAIYKFFGMTAFSIVCVVTLMVMCWKKSIKLMLAFSALMALFYIAVTNESFIYLLLFLIVGLSSGLLSKAGRKGILIGLLFTTIYCMFFAPTKDKIYSSLGYNRSMMEDFNSFMKEQNKESNYNSNELMYLDMDNMVEEMTNTPYAITLKEMLIGFAVLMLLPNSFYRAYESITKDMISEDEFNKIKSFNNYKIYLLNAAKPEDEKEEKPKKKTTKKEPKDNKSKKKSNKKQNKKASEN